MTATELTRDASSALRDAREGRRTPITYHGITIAAVVSADDLKQLEASS